MRAPDAAAAHERRERLLPRFLLVAIILAAPAALGMMRFWQEPYPSLIMPGFGTSWDTSGDIVWLELSILAVSDDGQQLTVTADELLPGVLVGGRPSVLLSAFIRGLDAEGRPLQQPRRPSVIERVATGLPPGMTTDGGLRAYDPQTIAWARDRMADLFPDERITEIRFALERCSMHPDRLEDVRAEPLQVVTVRLTEGR